MKIDIFTEVNKLTKKLDILVIGKDDKGTFYQEMRSKYIPDMWKEVNTENE